MIFDTNKKPFDYEKEYESIPVLYTRKDLLNALRAKGLPSTWMQINVYYTQKMLPSPTGNLSFHRKDTEDIAKQFMYVYTKEKIDETVEAVAKIKEYERDQKKKLLLEK